MNFKDISPEDLKAAEDFFFYEETPEEIAQKRKPVELIFEDEGKIINMTLFV